MQKALQVMIAAQIMECLKANYHEQAIFRRMKQDKFVPISFSRGKKEVIRRLLKSDLKNCVLHPEEKGKQH